MKTKQIPIYTAAQTKELDRLAIAEVELSGYILMQRAAEITWHHIVSKWPDCHQITVICGIGNNGGDGYLIAELALSQGFDVRVYQLGDVSKQQGDALTARKKLQTAGLQIQQYLTETYFEADVIVDAIFGIGLKRAVEDLWLAAIHAINLSSAQIAAVDIPSGLDADTGCQLGLAVKANITVTYIGRKQGLLTADGVNCVGELFFDDLKIPAYIYEQVPTTSFLMPKKLSGPMLRPRHKNSHKGQHGHVLIVGGGPGMSGAVMMAASAALRCGCGLVSVATHPSHATSINQYQPEIMSHAIHTSESLSTLIMQADVIVFGPGLGQSPWADSVMKSLIGISQPVIIDADGLNWLARSEYLPSNFGTPQNKDSQVLNNAPDARRKWIITPHPGEAARLLNCSNKEIQTNRFKSVKQLQEKYGCVVVLKGAGTLVMQGEMLHVNASGNPGMASAGMGDILSGVIASLVAQAMQSSASLLEITSFSVTLHGNAGDEAAKKDGEKGLLATDLLPYLRKLINE